MPSKRRHHDGREIPDSFGHRPMTAGTNIPPTICAVLLSAGCVSGGRLAHDSFPMPLTGQAARLMPGSWARVVVLDPGSRVVITMVNGDRIESVFRSLDADSLDLTDLAGLNFAVVRSKIRRIVVPGEGDPLIDGALIGAGIGLAAAGTTLAVAASGEGYILPSAKWGAPLLMSVVGGVVGVWSTEPTATTRWSTPHRRRDASTRCRHILNG